MIDPKTAEALALLRELEWTGFWRREEYSGCPVCGGAKPEEYDSLVRAAEQPDISDDWRRYWYAELAESTRGHTTDCRLSAVIETK